MNEELKGKKEMGKLYSFGCSHTAGTPNLNDSDELAQIDYWKSVTYPSHVAKEFGLENINLAVGGTSSKDVYRRFFTTLPKITTDDFVLFQPSFPQRRELHLMYDTAPFPVSITELEAHKTEWILHLIDKVDIPKKYYTNMKNAIYYMLMSDWVFLDSLVSLYSVMEILETKNIKYIVCGYYQHEAMVHLFKEESQFKDIYAGLEKLQDGYNKDPFNYKNPIDILNLVDELNLKKIHIEKWPLDWSEPKIQKYHIPNDGHWNEKGHKYWGSKLIELIKEIYY